MTNNEVIVNIGSMFLSAPLNSELKSDLIIALAAAQSKVLNFLPDHLMIKMLIDPKYGVMHSLTEAEKRVVNSVVSFCIERICGDFVSPEDWKALQNESIDLTLHSPIAASLLSYGPAGMQAEDVKAALGAYIGYAAVITAQEPEYWLDFIKAHFALLFRDTEDVNEFREKSKELCIWQVGVFISLLEGLT